MSGKVIFNFSLRKAQEQGYYQKINNYQITKYSEEEADKAIAAKAVSVLESDLAQGFDHIIMARCKSKTRAEQVYKVYKHYDKYSPVVVYSGMPGAYAILKAIKEKTSYYYMCQYVGRRI